MEKNSSESSEENLIDLINNGENIPGIEDCTKSKMYFRQWVTSFNVSLCLLTIGMAHGHSTILLQQLQSSHMNATQFLRIENGEIFEKPILFTNSVDLQSWIASIMLLFMIPGCWILAICSKKIGRKPIWIIFTALASISWMIVAFASTINHILIGRCMIGLCIGVLAGLCCVYQGECSIPRLRPILNGMLSVFLSIGIGLCHAIGTWFHWRTTAAFIGLFTFISLFLNFLMPESPIWLLNQNRFYDALSSWTFLRGIRDLDELKSMYTDKLLKRYQKTSKSKQKNKYCALHFCKPLGIILILFTVSQLSGMGAVTIYCIQIVTDIVGPESAHIPTLILDSFRLLFAIVLVIATKKYSTRALIVLSSFNSSLLLILLAIVICFNIWAPWLALILLFAYEAVVIMGIATLPWTFCSELFSVHKEIGIGIVTSFNYALFFCVIKVNPYLFLLLKTWGAFLFYGLCTLFGSIAFYFIVPNTRKMTLKEIELMFNKT